MTQTIAASSTDATEEQLRIDLAALPPRLRHGTIDARRPAVATNRSEELLYYLERAAMTSHRVFHRSAAQRDV